MINLDYLYITGGEKSSQNKIGFCIETENFKIEILCFKQEVHSKWIELLGKYCVKTDLLSEYKLKKKAGRGGFAVVYIGERRSDEKIFALKLMDKRKIENEKSYVKNFF